MANCRLHLSVLYGTMQMHYVVLLPTSCGIQDTTKRFILQGKDDLGLCFLVFY